MTTKEKTAKKTNASDSDEIAALRAMLAAKDAELEKLKTKAPARARKLTPEEEAKRKEREEWESVPMAEIGSLLRYVQERPRLSQIDALPKLVRQLKWDRVAPMVLELAEEVAKITGRTTLEVLEDVTFRHPVKKADEANSTDGGEAKPESEAAQGSDGADATKSDEAVVE